MRIVLFFILLTSWFAHARQIEAVVGWDKPPYVMQDRNSGFEVELVRQILSELGHELIPVYVPFGRTVMMVNDRQVEMGLTMSKSHEVDPSILSDTYVIYQNVAISLQQSNLALTNLSDLAGLRVLSFQTASEVLGEAFRSVVPQMSGYVEVPIQDRQLLMLMSGSVDVAILDRNIFNYMQSHLLPSEREPIAIHELFDVIPCSVAIHDPVLRRQFNQKLAEFIADGRYQVLLDQFGLVNLLDRLPQYRATVIPSPSGSTYP
ncbi:substrate-binding periplasmic protein [Alteromonas sp. CYL-A6]|uniref:substrate-binding periplasmic protein n=1 Tax=Alteromonas nitratireducens TaxID=3390813 RepID=UPI0039837543